ncbi:MAG: response regulator [Deltaproteobacteria bacterium]|jgi:CheY-like chemotaxis protein
MLIVDDREDERYLLRRRLRKIDASFAITEAASAAEAERVLADSACRFDVVFLDVNMPIVSGMDLLPRLADLRERHAHLADLAVLMYTSSIAPADADAARAHDFVHAFLDKDSDLESMRAHVNAALG